jgi:hypothetical protein
VQGGHPPTIQDIEIPVPLENGHCRSAMVSVDGTQIDVYREAILIGISRAIYSISLAVLTFAPGLYAQQSKAPAAPPGPVPEQIGTSKKVFIANGGGESFETVIDQIVFNGGPDRPYNEFYAALNGWGRYILVSSPSDADLVLEINWALTDTGLKLPVLGQLRLQVIDPKTHITLWSFIEYVRGAILLGNRDKNFDQAMNTIVSRLKKLTEPLVSSPPQAAAGSNATPGTASPTH